MVGMKSADDDVDVNKSICIKGSDVVMRWDVRPVFFKHFATELVALAKLDCSKRSGSFEAEGEASDAGKKVDDPVFCFFLLILLYSNLPYVRVLAPL